MPIEVTATGSGPSQLHVCIGKHWSWSRASLQCQSAGGVANPYNADYRKQAAQARHAHEQQTLTNWQTIAPDAIEGRRLQASLSGVRITSANRVRTWPEQPQAAPERSGCKKQIWDRVTRRSPQSARLVPHAAASERRLTILISLSVLTSPRHDQTPPAQRSFRRRSRSPARFKAACSVNAMEIALMGNLRVRRTINVAR
jgi:hypothetical protein